MAYSSIRRATVDDAKVLADLGRRTFVDTFGHLYPPGDLEGFLDVAYAPDTFEAFLTRPGHALWIAEDASGRALGFAQAGPCALPHEAVTSGCGELKRLYVDKPAQGRGVGSALLKTALKWLKAPGRKLWVGVWSQNLGAQRLYARHGFRKVGEYYFPVGRTQDHEFILRRG